MKLSHFREECVPMLNRIDLMKTRMSADSDSAPSTSPESPVGVATRRNSSDGLMPFGRHDRQLASYMVARFADDRRVGPDEFDQLVRCTRSLKATRDEMHRGRANVNTDLARSDHQVFYLCEAVRSTLRRQQRVAELNASEEAGVAAHNHVGKCQEHATVALHAHAPLLRPGERVELHKDSFGDHAFAVHVGTDGTALVIDPWAEGPVVNASDAAYADGSKQLVVGDALTAHTAPDRIKAFRTGQDRLGPALAKAIDAERSRLEASNARPMTTPWNPEPAVSAAFAGRARAAIDRGPASILKSDRKLFDFARSWASRQPRTKPGEQSIAQQWALVLAATFSHAGAAEKRFAKAVLGNPDWVAHVVAGARSLRRPDPRRNDLHPDGAPALLTENRRQYLRQHLGVAVGHASGAGLNCLLESFLQLVHDKRIEAGQDLPGRLRDITPLLRDILIQKGLAEENRFIDVYGGAAQYLADAYSRRIQIIENRERAPVVHPVIGDSTHPLLQILHTIDHFQPLWPLDRDRSDQRRAP